MPRVRGKSPADRYELITCGLGGHVVVGTDVKEIVPEDQAVVREHDGLRWYRCLRCDAWLPRQPPERPTRERMPSRDEIEVPLRGRELRDRYVLRLIAVERAVHVLVFSGLAVAVFFLVGHRKTLRRDYISIMNSLFGSSETSAARRGLLGEFRHLLVISPSHLYEIGLLLVAYASLEAVEMVGLWLTKRWAEYLTFVATSAFVPFEVYELATSFGWFKLATLIVNLAIVVFLLVAKRLFGLRGGRRAELARRRADSGWEAIDRRPVGRPPLPLEPAARPSEQAEEGTTTKDRSPAAARALWTCRPPSRSSPR
jgi:uncharacterized membrane protein (DUF2068 family)